jgi:hypothetical protein
MSSTSEQAAGNAATTPSVVISNDPHFPNKINHADVHVNKLGHNGRIAEPRLIMRERHACHYRCYTGRSTAGVSK